MPRDAAMTTRWNANPIFPHIIALILPSLPPRHTYGTPTVVDRRSTYHRPPPHTATTTTLPAPHPHHHTTPFTTLLSAGRTFAPSDVDGATDV